MDAKDLAALKDGLNKEASADAEYREKLKAFDYGMEQALAEDQFEKAAFSKAAGVENPEELAEVTTRWLSDKIAQA